MRGYLKIKCRREALGMSKEEFAKIAKVDEEMISKIEEGEIGGKVLNKVQYNTYQYLKRLSKKEYLTTELIEEALYLRYEDETEHMKTLTHIALHANKMNMSYVGEYRL